MAKQTPLQNALTQVGVKDIVSQLYDMLRNIDASNPVYVNYRIAYLVLAVLCRAQVGGGGSDIRLFTSFIQWYSGLIPKWAVSMDDDLKLFLETVSPVLTVAFIFNSAAGE